MRFLLSLPLFVVLSNLAFAAAEADLLVAFDSSYTDGVGGDENAKVLTANSVAASNWINQVSGSPARMRICGYHKTWWQGGRSTLGGYVNWLNNYNDSYLNDVTAAADAAGADLVAYICAPSAGEGSAAVAQQPGRYAAYAPAHFWNNVVAHESGGHNYGLDHRVGRENPKTIMLHNYCGGGSQGYYSNPHIWLNGTKLLGQGSCLGGAVQGGDAVYNLSTAAQGRADSRERVTWGSWLSDTKHRWQFNQTSAAAPAGTTITDSVSGAVATVRGQGASFTGDGLLLPGGTNGNTAANSIAAYIDLPNGLFSSMPNFTLEIWASPMSGQNWMRVIEIGRPTQAGDGLGAAGEYTAAPGSPAPGLTDGSDVIGLSASTASTSLNNQRLIAGLNGTWQNADTSLATTAGQMYHYAVVFSDTSSGGTIKWFRNGVLIRTLNVSFKSSQIEDVNNWLGRSLWSGDSMAHIEYHDVRIHSAALRDEQLAANYLIGPFDTVSTLWANDSYGNSSFFSGAWEFGATTVSTRDYDTGEMRLRTPPNSSNHTFPGKSLTVTGGDLILKGTASNVTTINDLRLDGGTIAQAGGSSTQTVAGNILVKDFSDNHIRCPNGPMTISASISGSGGSMLYTENPVTLTANNSSYLGATIVGDGRFSTLKISNETNLGGNPTSYGGAWLQLNRGILETTATMTIDDVNRGVRIGPSGGIFRPAAGTTLTIATPLTSPASGDTQQTAPMFPNPVVGMLTKESSGTLVLTNPNNSYIGEMVISQGELRLDGAGRLNNGDHHMPLTLNGTLHVNTTGNQIFGGVISGGGTFLKNNTGTTTFYAANTFTGSVTINGGTIYARANNAANNRNFSHVSGITINNGGTLRSQTNSLFGSDGTQTKPITVNAGGILTTDAANADVNVGTITLNGGTLAGFTSSSWGSWCFKRVNGGKLVVTDNATVSAPNVGLGTNNSVEVTAGKTLTWSGAITNLSSEGTVALVKKNGTGTLVLTGSNTYTGPTSLEAGLTRIDGSLGNTAVTVAAGATLGGGGSVAGATSIAGTHAPGNSAGAQSFGGTLNYSATSTLAWELTANSTAAASFDSVTAAGAATIATGAKVDVILNSAGSGVALNDAFWSQPRAWTILTAAGVSGTFALGTVGNDPAGRPISEYGSFSIEQDATSVTLVFTPLGSSNPSAHQLWLQDNFGEDWDNAAVSGDEVDGDHDGLSNLLEYALGTDPNNSSGGAAPKSSTDDGKLKITFTRNSAASDLTISVMAADGLVAAWTEIARSENGAPFIAIAPEAVVNESGGGQVKDVETTDIHLITDPAHPKRFMRVEVKR